MKVVLLFMLLPVYSFGQKVITYVDPNSHPDTIAKRTALINTIFLSDSICITLKSSGCFHREVSTYFIVKKGENRLLSYIDSHGNKRKSKPLESKKYMTLKNTCLKGLSIGTGFCTTRETVLISDRKSATYFIDGRCSDTDSYLDKINSLLK